MELIPQTPAQPARENSHLRTSFDAKLFSKIKQSIILRQSIHPESFLNLSTSELKQAMLEIYDDVLRVESTLGYRAAEIIANAMNDPLLIENTKDRYLLYRISYYTKSRDDGWNLAFERATTLPAQMLLFNLLKEVTNALSFSLYLSYCYFFFR